MRKLVYTLLMASTLTTPTIAVTAAPVWSAEDDLRLDDSVFGTWCVTNRPQPRFDDKNTRIYERSQNCFNRFWIVIGPQGYRTSDRQCVMVGVAGAEYIKNLLVQYRCTSYENGKIWIERAEFGFFSTDHLYIIRS
jgi:hypothetical protein